MKVIICFCFITLIVMIGAAHVSAQNPDPAPDLTTFSMEDLMNLEVTSVSKKEEKLFRSAAAIYVITQEEIRRSGLTTIPEVLRMAPGLSVARIDGSKWAISARGFNGRFANKLLVLIDGRSVYTPQFAGMYWEIQNLPLEEVERIEVIRGPGGTLWGANAVNGVINIITKRAEDSQGGLLTIGGGSEEQGFGLARYGARIGADASYRVYAKYFNRGGLVNAAGYNAHDWQNWVGGGWRLDWQRSERETLTVQGDIHDTGLRETSTSISLFNPLAPRALTPAEYTGGNVMGRWTHAFSDRSDMTLQTYFDRSCYNSFDVGERVDTFDLDFQHRLAFGRQDLLWGLGYRVITDRTRTDSPTQFTPPGRTSHLFSAFAQDELMLVKDRLRLTIGSKLEHHYFTGFDAQPNARLLWTPSARQTVWAAVSRAVRTPARSDRGLRYNNSAFFDADGLLNVVAFLGNPKHNSEEIRAYEVGYRAQPNHKLFFDLAVFRNFYDRLQSIELDRPFLESDPPPAHLILPLRFDNLVRGDTYGVELLANLNPARRWRLSGGYSYLGLRLSHQLLGHDPNTESLEDNDPRHQFQLHSYLKLARSLQLDNSLYHVSPLLSQQIPAYTRLDARFGWKVRERFELSLSVQNLLDDRHPEFNGPDASVVTSQARRSVYGKMTWQF